MTTTTSTIHDTTVHEAVDEIEQRVTRGAQLLDERLPGWAEKVDPNRLAMNDAADCVLGQQYGWYYRGARELGLTAKQSAAYGFTFDDAFACDGHHARWDVLTDAWRREITRRHSDLRAAARTLLDAHDALVDVEGREPACDEDTGLPYNASAWLLWSDSLYKPHAAAWRKALETFRTVYGANVNGHPFTFRPLAEAIVDGRPRDEIEAHLDEYRGQLHWRENTTSREQIAARTLVQEISDATGRTD